MPRQRDNGYRSHRNCQDSVHMERAEAKITVFMYLNEAKDSVHMEYTKVLYRYSEKKCKSYLEVVEGQLKGEIGT